MDKDCIREILELCDKPKRIEAAYGALQAVKHRVLQYVAENDKDYYCELTDTNKEANKDKDYVEAVVKLCDSSLTYDENQYKQVIDDIRNRTLEFGMRHGISYDPARDTQNLSELLLALREMLNNARECNETRVYDVCISNCSKTVDELDIVEKHLVNTVILSCDYVRDLRSARKAFDQIKDKVLRYEFDKSIRRQVKTTE